VTAAGTQLELSDRDRVRLAGAEGPALRLAMNLIVRAGEILGAERLIDVSFAHIDACHYSHQAHFDFAEFMAEGKARMAVPAWTNTIPVSLVDTDLRAEAGEPDFHAKARRLTGLYVQLGCRPVWTCAPYQLPGGPKLGDQIVGSESNAVAYYNSVVGARTNKYGDFLDVAAAVTGRVPDCGLHTTEGRRGQLLITLEEVPEALRRADIFYHLLGHLVGREARSAVPVIDGLPADTTKDQLKAVSAAVAASGGVGLFHAVGVTPEAPSLEAAFQGHDPERRVAITVADLAAARAELSPARDGPLDLVALGTPHFSFTEFARLVELLDGRRIGDKTLVYVSTSRHVRSLIASKGWLDGLAGAGGPGRRRHLHLLHARRARLPRAGHDQLRQAGLLRARPAAGRGGLRQPRGVCRVGGAGRGLARPELGRPGMTAKTLQGQVLNPGEAAGAALVLSEPLSFWGGFDPASGRVIDRHHPQLGAELAGKILVLPESRGSGGTPAGVAEAIRHGTAPLAFILGKADANVSAGALAAAEHYGREVPVVALAPENFGCLRSGDRLTVTRDGRVKIARTDGLNT